MEPSRELFKVLVDGRAAHGGDLGWSLPTPCGEGWIPGEWHTVIPPIRVCRRGLHLTREPQRWLKVGCEVYAAEGRGASETKGDKTAFAEARLVRPAPEMLPAWWRSAMDFISAIPAVPFFQPQGAPESSWRVVTAATWDAAWDAARDAAWDAARGAARGAASDAAWDAARGAASDAAWDAARDAAWDAAWGAARGAARDAARGAARGAAWVSAWDAAWDAARGAAWGAAWGAARDAAWDAALFNQMEHICAGLPIDERHRVHARARWEVWQRGYGLLGDVDGILYVCRKES